MNFNGMLCLCTTVRNIKLKSIDAIVLLRSGIVGQPIQNQKGLAVVQGLDGYGHASWQCLPCPMRRIQIGITYHSFYT